MDIIVGTIRFKRRMLLIGLIQSVFLIYKKTLETSFES